MEFINDLPDLSLVDIDNISGKVSSLLKEIVDSNDFKKHQKNDIFSTKKPIKVDINYYIARIIKYSSLENSSLIISLIYIDRLCSMGNIKLTPFNIYNITFACILMAIKYNEDTIYDNKYFSQIAGMSLEEANALEYNCLSILKYNLFIDDKIFDKYLNYIRDL